MNPFSGGKGKMTAIIQMMRLAPPEIPEDLNGKPQFDETGNVDLGLVEYFLSLTPAQRLDHAQSFATMVLTARRDQGMNWTNTNSPTSERSSGG